MSLIIGRQEDFALRPENEKCFETAVWHELRRVEGKKGYRTGVKAVRSDTGIYFLFQCEDEKINCTLQQDGEDLYTEDVLEIFLQPDRRYPVYLEYELSPLNKELVLMVCHNGSDFYGWLPFHYAGERRVKHITWSRVEELSPGACCSAWNAMVYLPFALFEGTAAECPAEKTVWRGNIFRIDTDDGEVSKYALRTVCGIEFHNFEEFEEIIFI